MARRIVVKNLSTKEIEKAKRNVQRYQKTLENRVQSLIMALTEKGERIAKVTVQQMGAFDSGNLESSIHGYYSPNLGVGIIRTNCYYAVYVEFGTGIRGSEAQHPKSGEVGYEYDVNNHGEDGWFYVNNVTGKSGWTTGMPSRPFMYETAMQLRAECLKLAKQKLRSR